jgi:hypothetical protein
VKLLDSLTVYHKEEPRAIELYHGDLTVMSPQDAVDVLIVSAYPNNYRPLTRTLIGALDRKGISVEKLARNKAYDARESFSSWVSAPIQSDQPAIQFNRILCFEPRLRGDPPEVAGDIFQALMPFMDGDMSIETVAMPLVATGNQGVPVADMLEPLIDAAVHWLELGLPVKRLKIVEHSELKAAELKGAFAILKKRYIGSQIKMTMRYAYDLFISYSHHDKDDTEFLVDELLRLEPGLSIFVDRKNLEAGAAWQQALFEALDDCNKVVPLYSPTYLTSKVCKEEFNIALFRHRETEQGTLIPIYLYSASLPSYMHLVQFIDCREASRERLHMACQAIVQRLTDE